MHPQARHYTFEVSFLPPSSKTMKSFTATLVATTLATTAAFQQPAQSRPSSALYEYIPSGFTKDTWAAFKAKEKKQKDDAIKKNLGRVGPKGFQSRSFQSFQEALERGEATHMMPVEFAKERLARGELKPEDIPVSFLQICYNKNVLSEALNC